MTLTTEDTISTKSKEYPIMKGVDVMSLSENTRKLAADYARYVEYADDPANHTDANTSRQIELSRTLKHNKYLAALQADGVDVSNRPATTGLALRWWRTLFGGDSDQ